MFVHVIISRLESLVQTFEVAPVGIYFVSCLFNYVLLQVSSILSFSRTRREFRSCHWRGIKKSLHFVKILWFSNLCFADIWILSDG